MTLRLWRRLMAGCVLLLSPTTLIAADLTAMTPGGTEFLHPAGWRLEPSEDIAILTAPEDNARMAIAQVEAESADAAVAVAWALLGVSHTLDEATDRDARFGWTVMRAYRYRSKGESDRFVQALAMRQDAHWSVLLLDIAAATMSRREKQVTRFIQSVRAPGYQPPTLRDRKHRVLSKADVASLVSFLDAARETFGIPGIGLGIVQNDKVLFAGGLGVRRIGRPEKVDARTLFLTASMTKPLTSLLLAKLVDGGKLNWATPAQQVLPAFRVGDAQLSEKIEIRHLLCSCTGIPSKDMDWIFAGDTMDANDVLRILGEIKPVAGHGELYQYSNLMAAAGGIVGGHAADPKQPLDDAYDVAMQRLVFDPLGMRATTFDAKKAQRGNHARPHGTTIDGETTEAAMGFNEAGHAMRADGGAWSNVEDLLKYLRMELASGRLPGGKRYIAKVQLDERLKPQVARGGPEQWYTMGLKTDRQLGILQVLHGGSMAGYQGEVFWLPEYNAGFVLLINADAGGLLRSPFARRFVEMLFDTDLGARKEMADLPQIIERERAEYRKEMIVPLAAMVSANLAERYRHPELGDIVVVRRGVATELNFGGWSSAVASVTDGERVFVETISPGVSGYRFEVRRRQLVLDDGEREYIFAAEEK